MDYLDQFAATLGRPRITATATLVPDPGPIPTVLPTPPEFQIASHAGHRTLWIAFVIMVVSSGVFALASWRVPVARRVYYVTTTLTTIIAALAYFAMATGQATTLNCNRARDHHDNLPDTFHRVCRQVYWAHYVDWALTTPLLLLNLSLLAGIDGAHILMAIVADVIMVLSGLFSALGRTGTAQKWGWFIIACVSYFFVIWHIALHGPRSVGAKGSAVKKLFTSLAIFTFAAWTVYPIVWGIAGNARKTSVNTEILIYAVLDVLVKTGFGLWFLISHRTISATNVDLNGFWSNGPASEGRIRVGDED